MQQLLYQESCSKEALVTAAVLLETAIHNSPYNAYLKFTAMDAYYQLGAMSRSWEFFQAVGLKHIQLDSCTFTILPMLFSGGLYNETIEVCNAMLRFQAGTARDCGEYAGRAMEAGTLSKADEFLVFQREKMNNSLTILQARGLILDSAPLYANSVPRKKHDDDPIMEGGLGIHQGIVGGDLDMDRASQMVVEAHNPYAALSLVSWADGGGTVQDGEDMSDNRDLSIFANQILYKTKIETKDEIVQDSLRRGFIHGLLIRSTLCVDCIKGPKKGKVVKNSEELISRALSLLRCIESTKTFMNANTLNGGRIPSFCCESLLQVVLDLCHVLVMVSSGLSLSSSPTFSLQDDDNNNNNNNNINKDVSLEERETFASDLLQTHTLQHLQDILQTFQNNMLVTSIQDVGWLVPSYMVPLFAIFRMCSNVFTTFGWGKRKCKTKMVAMAFSNLAQVFAKIVEALEEPLERYE